MSEVDDFDQPPGFVNPIVNRVGGVKYLSDVWSAADRSAHIWKTGQNLDMEIVAKLFRRKRKVSRRVFEDGLKIG
jgi:hypothetical protein